MDAVVTADIRQITPPDEPRAANASPKVEDGEFDKKWRPPEPSQKQHYEAFVNGERRRGRILDESSELHCKLGTILGKVSAEAGLQPDSVQLTVLRSDEVNAFILPPTDGTKPHVFITTGLIKALEAKVGTLTESHLAFILGHELAHYVDGHFDKFFEPEKPKAKKPGLLPIVDSNVVNWIKRGFKYLCNLTYQRSQEFPADRLGLQWSVEAGYEGAAGVEVLRALKAIRDDTATPHKKSSFKLGGYLLNSFFRTHPIDESRIERAIGELSEIKKTRSIPEILRKDGSSRTDIIPSELIRKDCARTETQDLIAKADRILRPDGHVKQPPDFSALNKLIPESEQPKLSLLSLSSLLYHVTTTIRASYKQEALVPFRYLDEKDFKNGIGHGLPDDVDRRLGSFHRNIKSAAEESAGSDKVKAYSQCWGMFCEPAGLKVQMRDIFGKTDEASKGSKALESIVALIQGGVICLDLSTATAPENYEAKQKQDSQDQNSPTSSYETQGFDTRNTVLKYLLTQEGIFANISNSSALVEVVTEIENIWGESPEYYLQDIDRIIGSQIREWTSDKSLPEMAELSRALAGRSSRPKSEVDMLAFEALAGMSGVCCEGENEQEEIQAYRELEDEDRRIGWLIENVEDRELRTLLGLAAVDQEGVFRIEDEKGDDILEERTRNDAHTHKVNYLAEKFPDLFFIDAKNLVFVKPALYLSNLGDWDVPRRGFDLEDVAFPEFDSKIGFSGRILFDNCNANEVLFDDYKITLKTSRFCTILLDRNQSFFKGVNIENRAEVFHILQSDAFRPRESAPFSPKDQIFNQSLKIELGEQLEYFSEFPSSLASLEIRDFQVIKTILRALVSKVERDEISPNSFVTLDQRKRVIPNVQACLAAFKLLPPPEEIEARSHSSQNTLRPDFSHKIGLLNSFLTDVTGHIRGTLVDYTFEERIETNVKCFNPNDHSGTLTLIGDFLFEFQYGKQDPVAALEGDLTTQIDTIEEFYYCRSEIRDRHLVSVLEKHDFSLEHVKRVYQLLTSPVLKADLGQKIYKATLQADTEQQYDKCIPHLDLILETHPAGSARREKALKALFDGGKYPDSKVRPALVRTWFDRDAVEETLKRDAANSKHSFSGLMKTGIIGLIEQTLNDGKLPISATDKADTLLHIAGLRGENRVMRCVKAVFDTSSLSVKEELAKLTDDEKRIFIQAVLAGPEGVLVKDPATKREFLDHLFMSIFGTDPKIPKEHLRRLKVTYDIVSEFADPHWLAEVLGRFMVENLEGRTCYQMARTFFEVCQFVGGKTAQWLVSATALLPEEMQRELLCMTSNIPGPDKRVIFDELVRQHGNERARQIVKIVGDRIGGGSAWDFYDVIMANDTEGVVGKIRSSSLVTLPEQIKLLTYIVTSMEEFPELFGGKPLDGSFLKNFVITTDRELNVDKVIELTNAVRDQVKDKPNKKVPEVFEWYKTNRDDDIKISTGTLLFMQKAPGMTLDRKMPDILEEAVQLVTFDVESVIEAAEAGKPYWKQCDPHPGNYKSAEPDLWFLDLAMAVEVNQKLALAVRHIASFVQNSELRSVFEKFAGAGMSEQLEQHVPYFLKCLELLSGKTWDPGERTRANEKILALFRREGRDLKSKFQGVFDVLRELDIEIPWNLSMILRSISMSDYLYKAIPDATRFEILSKLALELPSEKIDLDLVVTKAAECLKRLGGELDTEAQTRIREGATAADAHGQVVQVLNLLSDEIREMKLERPSEDLLRDLFGDKEFIIRRYLRSSEDRF